MPAEEHLPARATVHEDDGGKLRPGGYARREEELAVNLNTVLRFEDDLLRLDEFRGREVARQRRGGEHARVAARERRLLRVRHRGLARVRAEVDEGLAVAGHDRAPLDAIADRVLARAPARDVDEE